jgi:fructokinase
MPDVVTVGEALVEFMSMEPGVALRQAPAFEKAVGAVPAKVAVGLARLEVSSGLIGRVGEDPFGHFVADILAAEDVDVSQLGFERSARTGLAFVSHIAEGQSEFVFFRHSSAEILFSRPVTSIQLMSKLLGPSSMTPLVSPSNRAGVAFSKLLQSPVMRALFAFTMPIYTLHYGNPRPRHATR